MEPDDVWLKWLATDFLVVAIELAELATQRFIVLPHTGGRKVCERVAYHGKLKIVQGVEFAVLEQILPGVILNQARLGAVLWNVAPEPFQGKLKQWLGPCLVTLVERVVRIEPSQCNVLRTGGQVNTFLHKRPHR